MHRLFVGGRWRPLGEFAWYFAVLQESSRPHSPNRYYIAPDNRLMAAPIVSSGTVLQPGLPTALFQPRIALGGTEVVGTRQQYDVAPDGRFLINVNVDEATAAPITVITNWQPEAKK